MEPFGLLNFLQTMLTVTDFSQKSAPENTENKEKTAPVHDTEKAELSANKQNIPFPEEKAEPQNAFTQFLSVHDARVKKTKN